MSRDDQAARTDGGRACVIAARCDHQSAIAGLGQRTGGSRIDTSAGDGHVTRTLDGQGLACATDAAAECQRTGIGRDLRGAPAQRNRSAIGIVPGNIA